MPYNNNLYLPNPLVPKINLSKVVSNKSDAVSSPEELSSPEFALLGDNDPDSSHLIVHMGSSNYDPRFKPIKKQSLYNAILIRPKAREESQVNPPEGTSDYTMMNYDNPRGSNIPVSSMKSRYHMPQGYYDNFKLNRNAAASYDIMDFSKDNLNKALYSNNKPISVIFSDFPFPSNSKFEIPDSDE